MKKRWLKCFDRPIYIWDMQTEPKSRRCSVKQKHNWLFRHGLLSIPRWHCQRVCLVCFCASELLTVVHCREVPYDKALLERYRKALDRAVQLATIYNVDPIPGTTLILCDLGPAMQQPCASAKGLGKPWTVSRINNVSCEN